MSLLSPICARFCTHAHLPVVSHTCTPSAPVCAQSSSPVTRAGGQGNPFEKQPPPAISLVPPRAAVVQRQKMKPCHGERKRGEAEFYTMKANLDRQGAHHQTGTSTGSSSLFYWAKTHIWLFETSQTRIQKMCHFSAVVTATLLGAFFLSASAPNKSRTKHWTCSVALYSKLFLFLTLQSLSQITTVAFAKSKRKSTRNLEV